MNPEKREITEYFVGNKEKHRVDITISWELGELGPKKRIENFKIEAWDIFEEKILPMNLGFEDFGEYSFSRTKDVLLKEIFDKKIIYFYLNVNTFIVKKHNWDTFGSFNFSPGLDFRDKLIDKFYKIIEDYKDGKETKVEETKVEETKVEETKVINTEAPKVDTYDFNVEEEDYFFNSNFGKLKLLNQGVYLEDQNKINTTDYIDSEYLEDLFDIEEENSTIVSEIEIPLGTYNSDDNFNNTGIQKPNYHPLTVTGSVLPSFIGRASSNSGKFTLNNTMKDEYIPIINSINELNGEKITIGLKLLIIAMTKHEGFIKGSKSHRTNNPGNIGNTDNGSTKSYKTLEEGIKAQLKFIKSIIKGKNGNFPVGKEKIIEPYYSPEIAKNQKNYGNMNPYLVGYKFIYTNQLNQFVKIYSTGSRGTNSYLTEILTWFNMNGYGWIKEETTLEQIVEQTNDKNYIYKNINKTA